MRSIESLSGEGKKKTGLRMVCVPCNRFIPLAFVLLGITLACLLPASASARGERNLGTQAGQGIIATDPATGDRVMRTPDMRPGQEQYQGPQTIIVTPEVYPGGRLERGHPPHRQQTPHRQQRR